MIFGSLASGLLASRNSELTAVRSWERTHSPGTPLKSAVLLTYGFQNQHSTDIQERIYRKLPSRTHESQAIWMSDDFKWIAWIPDSESLLPEVFYRGSTPIRMPELPHRWNAYPSGWKGFEEIIRALDSAPKLAVISPIPVKKTKSNDPRALFY